MKKASVEARITGEVQVRTKKLRFNSSQFRDVLKLLGKKRKQQYRLTFKLTRQAFRFVTWNQSMTINCSLQSGQERATSPQPPATTASCVDARACADADDGASRCEDTPVDPSYQLRHFCPATLRIGCPVLA